MNFGVGRHEPFPSVRPHFACIQRIKQPASRPSAHFFSSPQRRFSMDSSLAAEAAEKLNVSSSSTTAPTAAEPSAPATAPAPAAGNGDAATTSTAPSSSSSSSSSTSKKSKPPHRKDPRSQSPLTQLSRALSYLLRHGAEKEKLPIRPDGFVPVSACLKHSRVKQIDMEPDNGMMTKDGKKKRRVAGLEDVRVCVEDVKEGEKRRFEMREEESGEWFVRAIQGHTLQAVVDLDHVPVTLDNLGVLALKPSGSDSNGEESLAPGSLPPNVEILHGTTSDAWELIKTSGGLSRMKRNHIHLARGRPGVESVGSGE